MRNLCPSKGAVRSDHTMTRQDQSILSPPERPRSKRSLRQYMRRMAAETQDPAPRRVQREEAKYREACQTFGCCRMKEEVQGDGMRLEYAAPNLKSHRGLVLAAVRSDGLAFRHVPDSLKTDVLVSYQAIRTNPLALHTAGERLNFDRSLALDLVEDDGLAFQHLHHFQDDFHVALAAVKQNGWAFRYASSRLRADRELVVAAVEAHGRNLCYVSDQSLRSDQDLLLRCIERNAWALHWASDSVRLDRDFLLTAVRANGWALRFAHPPYNTNRTLVEAAAASGAVSLPRSCQSRARAMDPALQVARSAPYGKGGHDSLIPPTGVLPWRKPPASATSSRWSLPTQPSQLATPAQSRVGTRDSMSHHWWMLPPHDDPEDGPTLEEYRQGVRQIL